jgi:hypothetical protein
MIMKHKIPFILSVLCASTGTLHADILPLNDALRATYTACIGIDENLADLKKMAGINTAITSVGTATGIGATVTGIVKSSKDAEIEELEKILEEIDKMYVETEPMSDADFATFMSDFNKEYDKALNNKESIESEISKLETQSKNLGNWRTGLMAGSTATNLAGAIIASKNTTDGEITEQIEACKVAVNNLRQSMAQARISGENISEAEQIANACGQYEFIDLSKINTKAKGAMISSAIGTATGITGTIMSASANTDNVRSDNSDAGKQKEKNLNLGSNILAGATTAASATATVFNATQIAAIKKVAEVATNCTGVLQ